ncbi:hypothetical protein ScPMuIL_006360 [Solemya velum]
MAPKYYVRFILDNSGQFRGKRILDIGSGCGATAIACKMAGASYVVANDIDPVALKAASLNSNINQVGLDYSSGNLIGTVVKCSVVLLGDMFYDEPFTKELIKWLRHLHDNGTSVFIGDPGRIALTRNPLLNCLTQVASYELPLSCQLENNGLRSAAVWKLENRS